MKSTDPYTPERQVRVGPNMPIHDASLHPLLTFALHSNANGAAHGLTGLTNHPWKTLMDSELVLPMTLFNQL